MRSRSTATGRSSTGSVEFSQPSKPCWIRGGRPSPGPRATRTELLEDFGRFEPLAEAGSFRSYREVLEDVARAFGEEYGVARRARGRRSLRRIGG